MRKFGTVHLVGTGPGDPDLLTVRAARLLSCAQAVVFDRLVGAEILNMIAPQAQRFNVGKQAGRHPFSQSQINELLISIARQGMDVVRLKGGDPFIFGRGGEEVEALAAAGIVCKVVPGITAASGCAAALGLPLTHRRLAESVRLITGHRQDNRMPDLDFTSLADPNCTLVIYMGVANLTYLREGLLNAGLSRTMPVAVIERGTTLQQRVLFSELGSLKEEVERWKPEPPSLLVIGQVVRLAQATSLSAYPCETAQ